MSKDRLQPKRGSKKYTTKQRELDSRRALREQINRRNNLRKYLPEGASIDDVEADIALKFLLAVKDEFRDNVQME
jgi:hypothetical protein